MTSGRFLICKRGSLEDLFAVPLNQAGTLVEFDGSQAPQDFDLLVLHGTQLSRAEVTKVAPIAKAALDHNKPVLVLKPTDAVKQELAQAGALVHYPIGDSLALLIEPQRDANGNLRLALSEQYAPNAGRAQMLRALARFDSTKNTVEQEPVDILPVPPVVNPTLADISSFVKRVVTVVGDLKAGKVAQYDAQLGGPTPPPASVPSYLYNVTPINIYYPITTSNHNALDGYYPPDGSVYFEGTVYLGVYYDNTSFNRAVQYLLIQHSGLYYTNGMEANDSSNRGWSVLTLDISGQQISDPSLVNNVSSPNNVNNQTQYTTSTQFSVGVSLGGGPEGPSGDINANYTVSSSQTNTISDWGLEQQAPNRWSFFQQNPYDGRNHSWQGGMAGENGVTSLPPISTGSLAYSTQTVWVKNPATTQQMTINYDYTMWSAYTHAFSTGKSWHAGNWMFGLWFPRGYSINFGAAWPQS